MPSLALPVTEAMLAVMDVETTGLRPEGGDRVVEIAIARSVGGRILDTYQTLINPERPMGAGAQRVHGISDAMVADAPTFGRVAAQVLDLLDGAVMVGHNAPFDLGFLTSELFIAGCPTPPVVALDTLRLARHYYPSGSYALGALSEAMDVRVEGRAHRAMADVLLTHGVLMRIVRDLWPRGVRTLSDYLRVQGGSLSYGVVDPARVPQPIRQALAEGRLLWIAYRNENGLETRRMVKPLQILERNTGLYLDAFCQLRRARRTFRLDRIVEMDVVQRF